MKLSSIIVFGVLYWSLISCSKPFSLAQNRGGIIDVIEMGAKGNGVTDDTKAIQHALDMASRSGAVVYFPSGVYVISRINEWNYKKYGLLIPSNVVLSGEELGKSIIKLGPGHGPFARMSNLINVENVTIKHLSFDGNLVAQAKREEHQSAIFMHNADNVVVENCKFYNTGGDGVVVRGPEDPSENVLVKNCSFRNNGRNGITLGSGFHYLTIDSCYFDATDMFAQPIDSEPEEGSCKFPTFSNNTIVNRSDKSTIVTIGGNVPVTGYKVYNNKVENCGFHIINAYDVEIYDNTLELRDDRAAINLIYESKNVNIHDNIINSKMDGVAIIATRVSAPSKIKVYNNEISTSGTEARGIRIQGANFIDVVDNHIRTTNLKASVGGIFVRSTGEVNNINIERNTIENYTSTISLATYKNFGIDNLKIKDNTAILPKNGKLIDCIPCDKDENYTQIKYYLENNKIQN